MGMDRGSLEDGKKSFYMQRKKQGDAARPMTKQKPEVLKEEQSDDEDKDAAHGRKSTAGPTSGENRDDDHILSQIEMLQDEDESDGAQTDTFKSLYQKNNRMSGQLMSDADIKKFEQEYSMLTHEDI